MLRFDETGRVIFDEVSTPDNSQAQPPPQQPTPQPHPNTTPGERTLSDLIVPNRNHAQAESQPEAPTEDSPGFLDYLSDIPKGVVNGATSAIQETLQFGWDVADEVQEFISPLWGGEDKMSDKMPIYDDMESFKFHTKTAVGKVTEGIVNVGLGILGAGKVLKVTNLLQQGGKAMMIGRGMVQGAAADAIVMDPLEDRLSNLVEEFPALENPITEALAADPDDSRWEGRLKNALEGLVIGTAAEVLLHGIKVLRASIKGDAKAVADGLDGLEAATAKAQAEQVGETAGEAAATPPKNAGKAAPKLVEGEAKQATEGAPQDLAGAEAKQTAEGLTPEVAEAEAKQMEGTTPAEKPKGKLKTPGIPETDAEEVMRVVLTTGLKGDDLMKEASKTINARYISSSASDEYLMKLHYAVARQVFQHTEKAAGSVGLAELTSKTLRDLGDHGFDMPTLYDMMISDTKQVYKSMEDLYAVRCVYSSYQDIAADIVRKNAMGIASPEEMVKQQEIVTILGNLQKVIADQGTAFGRGLVSMRHPTRNVGDLLGELGEASSKTDVMDASRAVKRLIDAAAKRGRIKSPAEWARKLEEANIQAIAGDPSAMKLLAQAAQAQGPINYFHEVFINSILSGIRTHLTNVGNNTVKLFLTPLERSLSHLRPWSFDPAAAKAEASAIFAIREFAGTALRYAFKALKENRPILEATASAWTDSAGPMRAWSRENVIGRHVRGQLDKGVKLEEAMKIPELKQLQAKIADGIGWAINLPGRFLTAEDEFFKRLNYLTEVKTNALSEALEKLPTAKSSDIADYVAERVSKSLDAKGRGVDKAGLEHAKRQTWTQDLRPGTAPRMLQDWTNNHPTTKFVLPFIRTPTNLLTDAIEHVPFMQKLTKSYKEAMKAGGREAAAMQGKAVFGGLICAVTGFLAAEGVITGSPPTDKAAREALERKGWQPHSIKIGGAYVSLNRLDPFAIIMSATANVMNAMPYLSEGEFSEAAGLLLGANLRLMGDKSYMQSLGNLLDATQGGNNYAMARLAQGIGRGMIPFSSLLGDVRSGFDDVTRDVNSFQSRIISRIPGWSETLPAKHDWLTGKPLPGGLLYAFGISPINEDVVARELAELGGVFRSPDYKLNNVQLSEAQHSRYCELIGTIKLDGRTLHQTLNATIRSSSYDLERKRNFAVDDGRSTALKKIIERYRQAAGKTLMREDPAFRTSVSDHKQEQRLRNTPNGNQQAQPQAPATPPIQGGRPLTPQQSKALEELRRIL